MSLLGLKLTILGFLGGKTSLATFNFFFWGGGWQNLDEKFHSKDNIVTLHSMTHSFR